MLSMEASELEELEYFALVMPTTSPYILKSAPPELPELMAQSVWIRSMVTPFERVTSLLRALTAPEVRENVSSPKGLPMATTLSPTFILSESPITAGESPVALTLSTAISLLSS